MTQMRLVMFGLIVVLVLTPLLGFAGGDVTLQTWHSHPRHATGQHDHASRFTWKSTPGTTAPPPPPTVLLLGEWLSPTVPLVALEGVSRLPFVPPRS